MSLIILVVLAIVISLADILLLHGQLKWLQGELRVANDRLYAASREPGAVIPPRDPEPVEIEPLPGELQAFISDYESPEARIALERTFRSKLDQGVSPRAILLEYLEPTQA